MNYELFIAKQIIAGKGYKNSVSSPIIKIAVLAIAIGIAIMLISIAIAAGFQQKIRAKMSGFKGHIQITSYDSNNSDISLFPIDKNQTFYTNSFDIEGVKKVQVYANKAGIFRTKNSFEGIIFKGVDKNYDLTFFKEYLVSGRLPNFNLKRNREVIISKTIADRLLINLNDTIQTLFNSNNTKVKFKQRKPIVVGIYDTGFLQFDKLIVLGDLREVQYLNKWQPNEVGGFEVLLTNFDDLKQVGEYVYKNIPPTLNSQTIIENYPAIFEWFKLVENNVWFIISFVMLIALINMITALLVLILERVQLIGILKSLGATNWSIRKIFLYNATYLILRGMFWGNLIAIMILLFQKYGNIITLNPESYYVSSVPVVINLWMVIFLNIGCILLCFIVLLIPSYIITKINPSKSVKFV